MALDTREKRMNAARVARPWMRARHAVGSTDEQSRIGSGHGYGGNALSAAPVAVPPEDRDDQDASGNTLTYTSFTDCANGATLRAARLTHWTAVESLRNADLNTPVRAHPSRRHSITAQLGRGTVRGVVHRFRISSNRAGEAWGSQTHTLEFSPEGEDQLRASETTAQTDCINGASLTVPQLSIYTASDSTRNADLGTPVAMTRDRYEQRASVVGVGPQYGVVRRIRITSNRAGDAWGSQAHVLEYAPEGITELRGSDI